MAADDPFAGLSQAERDYLLGKGLPATAPAQPAPAAPAAAAAAGPTATTTAAPGFLQTMDIGTRQGVGTVLNAPNYVTGGFIPRFYDTTLTPQEQAGVTAHPYAAAIGRTVGETAATLPVAGPLGELAGAGAGLITGSRLLGGIASGAASGAAQNLLTGAEAPQESPLTRAAMGAALGAPLGGLGAKVGDWFGAGVTIPAHTQQAGQVLTDAGIDLTPHNLPGATLGPDISTKMAGAPPNPQQAQQIASAISQRLGGPQTVPNLDDSNLGPLMNDIASRMNAAAAQGQINAGSGSAFDQTLNNIATYAKNQNVDSAINPIIKDIRAHIKNGVISGSDYAALVGPNSPIYKTLGSPSATVFEQRAAQLLDQTMDAGFQAGATAMGNPGAYPALITAKTDYRLGSAVKDAVDQNGFVNPTTLWSRLTQRFPDLKAPAGVLQDNVSGMGELASALRTGFGGTPPNISAAAPAPPGIIRKALAGAAGGLGTAGGLGAGYTLMTNPAAVGQTVNLLAQHIPMELGTTLPALAAYGLYRGGQAFQRSPAFINALVQRGAQQGANWLSTPLGIAGPALAPTRGP